MFLYGFIRSVFYRACFLCVFSLYRVILAFSLFAPFIVWNKSHKKPINEQVPIEELVQQIRERSEYLPVWDEAVVEWMNNRRTAKGN